MNVGRINFNFQEKRLILPAVKTDKQTGKVYICPRCALAWALIAAALIAAVIWYRHRQGAF